MKAGKNDFVHQGKLQSNGNMLIQDKELGRKSYEQFKTLEPQIKNFFCGITEKIVKKPSLSTGYLGVPTAERTRREYSVQICLSVPLQWPCNETGHCRCLCTE